MWNGMWSYSAAALRSDQHRRGTQRSRRQGYGRRRAPPPWPQRAGGLGSGDGVEAVPWAMRVDAAAEPRSHQAARPIALETDLAGPRGVRRPARSTSLRPQEWPTHGSAVTTTARRGQGSGDTGQVREAVPAQNIAQEMVVDDNRGHYLVASYNQNLWMHNNGSRARRTFLTDQTRTSAVERRRGRNADVESSS